MTSITVENITKRFLANRLGDTDQEIIAIDNVSFKIKSGGRLAILGPSGCGKTTLLRIIAGLERPDSGRVLYDNVDLELIENKQRGIGMVFQEWALIPHWEAGETVAFFLRLRKREHEVPERVKEVSAITGIGINHLMHKMPDELSGGEKQRVAIARAFARDLRLLLFDEPFASLDAKFRETARVELKRLLNEFPTTAIFVTHDQIEATALTERIVLMREGHIEQIGSYQQLYYNPRNLFVAQFIDAASMNLFPGRVSEGKWLGATFGSFPLRSDLQENTPVTMGIRSENIHLREEGTPAVIDTIVPHFSQKYQELEVWLGRERWRIKTPLDPGMKVGTTIYCAIDPSAAMYFDTRTGERIG